VCSIARWRPFRGGTHTFSFLRLCPGIPCNRVAGARATETIGISAAISFSGTGHLPTPGALPIYLTYLPGNYGNLDNPCPISERRGTPRRVRTRSVVPNCNFLSNAVTYDRPCNDLEFDEINQTQRDFNTIRRRQRNRSRKWWGCKIQGLRAIKKKVNEFSANQYLWISATLRIKTINWLNEFVNSRLFSMSDCSRVERETSRVTSRFKSSLVSYLSIILCYWKCRRFKNTSHRSTSPHCE